MTAEASPPAGQRVPPPCTPASGAPFGAARARFMTPDRALCHGPTDKELIQDGF